MSRKQPNRQESRAFLTGQKYRVIIVIAVLASLAATGAILARTGAIDGFFRQKGNKGKQVSTESFNSNSPSKEYVYAGGKLVATEEPTTTGSSSAPTNLRATTTSSNLIHLSWSAAANATRYELQKSSNYGLSNHGFNPVNSNIGSTSFDDTVTSGNAYIYQVLAIDQNNNYSAPSNLDIAYAFTFTDDPISTGMTVKEVHITQLRQAVDAVRLAAGRSAATWSDPPPLAQTILIQKRHIVELRSNLDDARSALSLPAPTYTDPTITQFSTVIKKDHVQQLRQLVKGYRTVTG
jgi:hypothetical protein